jgi:hypothetical protein
MSQAEPFNLDSWRGRWDEVAADWEATVLLDPQSSLRKAAEVRCEGARLMLLAELAVALADTDQLLGDYYQRPGLWAIQEAARHATGRPWIVRAA